MNVVHVFAKFVIKSAMNKHIVTIHERKQYFKCEICGATLKEKPTWKSTE